MTQPRTDAPARSFAESRAQISIALLASADLSAPAGFARVRRGRRRTPWQRRQDIPGRLLCTAVFAILATMVPVSASRAAKQDAWVEVRSPHFVILTNAGQKAALRTAIQFEQVRDVFNEVFRVAATPTSPTIVVLAMKDESSLRSLIPQYWTDDHARPAGIFSHRLRQFYVAIDLGAPGPNPYRTIYHEYFHSLTTPYLPALPAWLAEGLADFYGNMQVNRLEASVGLPDENLLDELKARPPIPLEQLFEANHTSPYYNDRAKVPVFHAESWAVTDYLMVGDHGAHRHALIGYIQALQHGSGAVEAARQEFGDLAKLDLRVMQYMRCRPLEYLHAPVPPPIANSDWAARTISTAEADVYIGGFLAVQGQTARAIALLEKELSANPADALARQNLALARFFADQRQQALDAASRAIALEPHNAITRYIRAYFSFGGSMLRQNPAMEADLRAAIAADSTFSPPYAFLAAYLTAQGRSIPAAFDFATKAVAINPSDSMSQLILAKVLARMDRFDDSRATATLAREEADDSTDRAAADSFLNFLAQLKNSSRATMLVQPRE